MNTGREKTAGELRRQYGAVKWFGGYNNRTGKENKFGFIECADGRDVFLHKREWQGKDSPSEGELVTFLEEEKDGKISASNAAPLAHAGLSAVELYSSLCKPPFDSDEQGYFSIKGRLKEAIKEALRQTLRSAKPEELRQPVRYRDAALSQIKFTTTW